MSLQSVESSLQEAGVKVMNLTLKALFQSLNEQRLPYFLLTDFESALVSNDLDLFVHPQARQRFEETLVAQGWYRRKEPTHHLNHYFYYSPHSDIYLDVKYALSFANGWHLCCSYKEMEQALQTAVPNARGVYRPIGIHALLLYAAHIGYKERGKVESKHRENLYTFLAAYGSEVEDAHKPLLEKLRKWLAHYFPSGIERLQHLLAPFFSAEPQKMVRNKGYLRWGLGLKVLFLGTDGAGKTTLIAAVREKLNLKTSQLYLGMGESGWTSPISKRLYQYTSGLRGMNKVLGLLKFFVLLPLEFSLRMLPVRWRSRYSVVLIDRFPGSVFLDRNKGRQLLFSWLLPQPDLVFFLYAPPEELVRRKPGELNLERSRADIQKFRKVAQIVSGGNYISIDTGSLSVGEASDRIISEIYKNEKVYKKLLTARLA
jgi:thymidylate kinase